jgi:hypothetical protein
MKILCPLGCEEITIYQNLQSHLDVCKNLEKKYKCNLCSKSFSVGDDYSIFEIENHKKNCDKILVKCVYCEKEMLRNQYEIHNYQCEMKILKCEKCKFNYPLKFKIAHDEFYCKKIFGFVENARNVFN